MDKIQRARDVVLLWIIVKTLLSMKDEKFLNNLSNY
jgi:hypothetical protein